MKKAITYIFSIYIICAALLFSVETAYAADITLSASKSSVEIGSTVTVTVTVPSNISGTLNIIYPTDVLEYSKASAEVNAGKAGTVAISIGKNGLAASNKVTITFKAKTAGEATVKANGISFFDNESYDAVNLGDASTKITVKNEAQNTDLSSDYYLAKLSVTAGSKKLTLSPTFNYRKTSYTATVDYDVTDVVVSVTRSSGKAEIVSITDNGKVKLQVGENRIEILVKAENGKTLLYVVTVTRKEKPADTPVDPPVTPDPPTPTEPDFVYGEVPLYAVETPDDKIPANFVEKTIILSGGREIQGLTFEKGDLTVVYLENENKVGSFYIYNAQENYIYPFVKLSAEESYAIVLMPGDEEVPAGFTSCTLSIEGKGLVNAYQYKETTSVDMSDFYLIYCLNHNGTKGWYQYDSAEGTYQRFIGIVTVPGEPGGDPENPGTSENPNPSENPGVQNPGPDAPGKDEPVTKPINWEEYKTLILCAAVFLGAVLVIIVINLLLTATRKATAGVEDDDDEDDDDDEYEYFDDKDIFKRTPQVVKKELPVEQDVTDSELTESKTTENPAEKNPEEEEELPKIDIDSVLEVKEESVDAEEDEQDKGSAIVEETHTEEELPKKKTSDDDESEVEFIDL